MRGSEPLHGILSINLITWTFYMNMYPCGCIEIMFICRVAIYWIYYPRSCWVILNNVLKLLFLSVTNRWCQKKAFTSSFWVNAWCEFCFLCLQALLKLVVITVSVIAESSDNCIKTVSIMLLIFISMPVECTQHLKLL